MLNIMKHSIVVLAVVGIGWTPIDAQTMSPTDFLKKRDKTLQQLASTSNTVDGEAGVRQAIVESFDFMEHSRISLGKHWKNRSSAEQEDFSDVMRAWTENRAIKKLLKRSEQTVYGSEELIGSTKALVKTTVRYKGTKTYVEYKMKLSGGKWRIYDMIVDGASIALANRDAFYKKISKTSYGELVATLKQKTLETD